ncbi:MAG: sulfatase-like hydrolase/transferase [Chitinophagaceae bacterium]
MLIFKKIPKLLRWILSIWTVFILFMTTGRLIFFWKYNAANIPFSGKAFLLGLRFDARYAGGLALLMLLLTTLPILHPFKHKKAGRFWNILLTLSMSISFLFYAIDFYHYDYLHQRLNATVLNYMQDAGISFTMMWQTYPLLKIFILLLLLAIGISLFFAALLKRYQAEESFYKRSNIPVVIFSFLFFAYSVVGNIIYKPGQYPLRWSDAFTFNNDFKSQLALNPFQSFFSTLQFRTAAPNTEKVRSYYRLMAQQLGVEQKDSLQLNFRRDYKVTDTFTRKPNVVLVICESFSAYKSGLYGNPLNTTPFFKTMAEKGAFYEKCFTPAYGTARGVWSTITGIPDVSNPSTASRNPNAVDQQTIINDFKCNNFYFIGGSATWANLRGLLTNNINGLHLYEQGSFSAGDIDVWGISDKNLFLEANKVLRAEKDPFFAVIQTADNHRPYTIPKEDRVEFKMLEFPKDSLRKYGFDTNEEMNAFRYTDYCFQKFMEAASKEAYYDNTIFVFVGDHGIRGNAANMFPAVWTQQGLTCEHVPLLFYAPKLIAPRKVSEICSQVDILPSIAGLAKINYSNNSFGRNLFDTNRIGIKPLSFIIDHDNQSIGVINEDYYFVKSINGKKQEMYSIINNDPIIYSPATISIKAHLDSMTTAYYETAKYLLYNNKKK